MTLNLYKLDPKCFLNFFAENCSMFKSNLSLSFDIKTGKVFFSKNTLILPRSFVLSKDYIKNNIHIEIYRFVLTFQILELNQFQEKNKLNNNRLVKVKNNPGIKVQDLRLFLFNMVDLVKSSKLKELIESNIYKKMLFDLKINVFLEKILQYFDFEQNKNGESFLSSKVSLINYNTPKYDLKTAIDMLLEHDIMNSQAFIFCPSYASGLERAKKKSKKCLMTGEEISEIINSHIKSEESNSCDSSLIW